MARLRSGRSLSAFAQSDTDEEALDTPPVPSRPDWRRQLLLLRRSRHVRYAIVGAFNTGFGYFAFVALLATVGRVTHYLVALVTAHVISVLVAFAGYRVIVFRVQGQVFKDFLRFWSVYAMVLGGNIVALPLLVEVAGFPVLFAQGIFAVVNAVVSYLAHGSFSFRRPILEDQE